MNVKYDEYIREGTKASMFAALDRSPDRSLDLLAALRAGRVNGNWYYGECACLIGILSGSNQRNVDVFEARRLALATGLRTNDKKRMLKPRDIDTDKDVIAAERLFLSVRPGDTTANNKYCAYAEYCILEWMRARGKTGPEEVGIV